MTTEIAQRLRELGAHHDVVQWAQAHADGGLTLAQTCPRGDWLLGIAARLGAPRRQLVQAAVACAREATGYLPEPAPTLTAALDLATDWTRKQASDDECAARTKEVEALATGDDAVTDSVVQAVLAALAAIREPDAAAHAAACTVHAAVLAAGDCAMESALRFTHERCAELVRSVLPPSVFAELLRAPA